MTTTYILGGYTYLSAGLYGSVRCSSDLRAGGCGFEPHRNRQHSFVEIDHEIFSTVILYLLLIQDGQLSVSGERMCTILVNNTDQTLHSAASDLGLHCLPITLLRVSQLQWVKFSGVIVSGIPGTLELVSLPNKIGILF